MSRSYYRLKPYSAGKDANDAVFIFCIFLFCSLWTHKALLLKVEHIAELAAISLTLLLITAFVIKLIRKSRPWKHIDTADIATIDQMTGLEFQYYVAKLLRAKGYKNISLTEEYDFGIDIIAARDGIKWGIQVNDTVG
jgi:HJR/Mrr/RecB family endonuclease